MGSVIFSAAKEYCFGVRNLRSRPMRTRNLIPRHHRPRVGGAVTEQLRALDATEPAEVMPVVGIDPEAASSAAVEVVVVPRAATQHSIGIAVLILTTIVRSVRVRHI